MEDKILDDNENDTAVMCKPLPSPDLSEDEKKCSKMRANIDLLLSKGKPPAPPPPRQSQKPRDPFDFYHKPKSVRMIMREAGEAPPEDPGEENFQPVDSGSTWRQLSIVLIINLVTFLQGASLPTSSVSTVVLKDFDPEVANQTSWPRDFKISESESTWISLSWLFGHLVSGILANPVAEMIGRRRSLLLDTLAFAVGFILYSAGENTLTLCAGRALLGYPLVSTVYVNELVHPEIRGVSAAVYATLHATGYSLILLIGAVAPSWRYAALVMGALALVPTLIVIFFCVPESPIWLIRRDRVDEARQSLVRMRGPSYDVDEELEDIKVAVDLNNCKDALPLKDMLWLMWCKKFRLPFTFLFVLFLGVGWSGFSYLANNGVELFEDNTSEDGFLNEYMLIFLVSLIKIPGGLFAAIFLKKFPRRPVFISAGLLVAFGHFLMSLTQLQVVPTWCGIAAITCAMFGYSAGYNSVASLLLGELLPAILRSVGVGLVATAEVLSSLSQTASETYLENTLGKGGLFIVFGTVVFLAVIYAVCFMPETSGLTLEQIENIWQSDKHPKCVVRRDPAMEIKRLSTSLVSPAVGVSRAISTRMSTRVRPAAWKYREDQLRQSQEDSQIRTLA